MQKRKIHAILLALLLLLIPIILTPSSRGEVVNLWGTSEGTSRTYTYTVTYTGSIEDTVDYGDCIFSIINIWDNDGNNYTELLYSRKKVGIPVMDLIALDDSLDPYSKRWNYSNLVNISGGTNEIYPLVPVGFNNADSVGLNWTAELQFINLTLENYTVTLEGNVITIHHWIFGIDGGTGAPTEEHEYFRWDQSTGWLISYEQTISYGDPANYVSRTLIQVKSEGDGGAGIDINLIIGIIGAIIGLAGITLGVLALKRVKTIRLD